LDTIEQLVAAMKLITIGDWHGAIMSKLFKALPTQMGYWNSDGTPDVPEVAPAEVHVLCRVIDLSGVTCVVDPWSLTPLVAGMLTALGGITPLNVTTNNPDPLSQADTHFDPLQPGFYEAVIASQHDCAFITIPPLKLLDLAVPLLMHHVQSVVCVYVPGTFIMDASDPRQAWLQALQLQDRLCVICGLPKGASGSRGAWLCIFKDALTRHKLVKGGVYPDRVFTLG
jgi:hypothetical protein